MEADRVPPPPARNILLYSKNNLFYCPNCLKAFYISTSCYPLRKRFWSKIKVGEGHSTKHLLFKTKCWLSRDDTSFKDDRRRYFRLKDTDGFTEVLQVPVYGSQAVPQFIGTPVQLIPTHLRPQKNHTTYQHPNLALSRL